MHYMLHLFNIFTAILTNFGLRPTKLKMFVQLVYGNMFRAKFTLLRFTLAVQFMLTKKTFHGNKVTELAFLFHMFTLLMVVLICLWYTLATSSTLIILSGTAHLMHSESRDIYLLVTYSTQFGLLWLSLHL